jgi:HlyD family secretion protein
MDIPRKSAARKRLIRRIVYGLVAVLVVVGVTAWVSRLKPAAPTVEMGTLWPDTVKRGPMLRQERGLGTLVPEEIWWIPAVTDGRVERRLVQPGTPVKADTVILELSNPDVEQLALDAEMQLKAAEAQYTNLKVQLESQLLNQQAAAANVRSAYSEAKLNVEAYEALNKQGLYSDLQMNVLRVRAAELATRDKIETQRLAIFDEQVKAQLAAQQAQVDQLRAQYQLRKNRVESLHVRAGVDGVLQQLEVQVGERVAPGARLARVANPLKLKAEVRVAETRAKDVQIGQSATIDTRNGVVPGRVVRIDPAVQNGTVTVDVTLEGPLPKGARPDLSVDGTIEIERLDDVIYVGRPAFGQENSTVGLFKLIGDGKEAVRVKVTLGRSSVNTIEIKDGLQPGDRVILSDMSQWDQFDRIRLR